MLKVWHQRIGNVSCKSCLVLTSWNEITNDDLGNQLEDLAGEQSAVADVVRVSDRRARRLARSGEEGVFCGGKSVVEIRR